MSPGEDDEIAVPSGRRMRVRYAPHALDDDDDEGDEGDEAERDEAAEEVGWDTGVPILPEQGPVLDAPHMLTLVPLPSGMLATRLAGPISGDRVHSLLIKMTKREAQRAARVLEQVSALGVCPAITELGDPVWGLFVWSEDEEDEGVPMYLGFLKGVIPGVFHSLRPGNSIPIVLAGGGPTRLRVTTADLVAARRVPIRAMQRRHLDALGLEIEAESDDERKAQVLLGALDPSADRRPPSRAAAVVGRNDPCPCGSGKKYKRCCLRSDAPAEELTPLARAANLHRLDREVCRHIIRHTLSVDEAQPFDALASLPAAFGEHPTDAALSVSFTLYEADAAEEGSLGARLLRERGARLSPDERRWLEAQVSSHAL
jgi:hypothetical protein